MLILPSPPEGAEHFPDSGGFMYQGETYVPMSYALTRRDIQKLKAAAWDEGHGTPCEEWVVDGMCEEYHPNPYRKDTQ